MRGRDIIHTQLPSLIYIVWNISKEFSTYIFKYENLRDTIQYHMMKDAYITEYIQL